MLLKCGQLHRFNVARILLAALLLVGGCATRIPSNIHPIADFGLFVHPTINLREYRSVHDRGNNDRALAVAVAISGGGERAANFGAGVLLGLELLRHPDKDDRDFLQEVDYLSTVSGGGMAVAAYLSSLYTHLERGNPREAYSFGRSLNEWPNAKKRCKQIRKFYREVRKEHPDQVTDPCLRRHLERGYHGNMLWVVTKPSMWFSTLDRGDLLEDAFAKELLASNWNKGKELTLGDIFVAADANVKPRFPYWVCNATVYENGAIFPFTPDILARYRVVGYTHHRRKVVYDPKRILSDMPVSVGMAASGIFPVVIPASTLRCDLDANNPYLHLIDGGVADNLGVMTAVELLRQDGAERKLLIVIDAFAGEFAPYSKNEGPPNVIGALPTIPLNSWRGRHHRLLAQWCKAQGITVVHFSFDDLYCYQQSNPYIEDRPAWRKLYSELGDDEYGFDPDKMPEISPWEMARGIWTSYNISVEDQRFLLAAGKYIVHRKREDLLKVWKSE